MLIRAKIDEYLTRAETLKKHIQSQDEKRSRKAVFEPLRTPQSPPLTMSHFVESGTTLAGSSQSNLEVRTPISLSSNHLIDLSGQKAIEIVQRAIDEDVKQNYAESYKQYMNALDYFLLVQKCTSVRVSSTPCDADRRGYSVTATHAMLRPYCPNRRKEREIQGVNPVQD